MKPGDMIKIPDEGWAKLIRLHKDYGSTQQWIVEFEDCPGLEYIRFIETTDN
jgi:hypothetical protein